MRNSKCNWEACLATAPFRDVASSTHPRRIRVISKVTSSDKIGVLNALYDRVICDGRVFNDHRDTTPDVETLHRSVGLDHLLHEQTNK